MRLFQGGGRGRIAGLLSFVFAGSLAGAPAGSAPPPSITRVEASPAPAPQAAAASGTVTVQRFEFTGNSVYPSERLAQLVTAYANRPLALAELYEAGDKVAAFYAADGYTLAAVTLPAQSVADGVVQFEVIEGRIGAVQIEGNRRYSLEQVAGFLPGVATGEIYRGSALESGLGRLSRLPGLTEAKAVLRPGASHGTSDLLIQAQEKTYSGGVAVDNHGRAALGELRTSVNAVMNNPLWLADELQVLYLRSQSGLLEYGSLGYSLAPGWGDLRLSGSYGEARFDTTVVGLTGVTVEGKNRTARAALELPLTHTRSDELSLSLGLSDTDATADLQGIPISAVKLTVAELSVRQRHVYGNKAVTQIVDTLSSSFGSACEMSAGCEDQPLRIEVDLQHLQPIVGRLDAYARFNAVYSRDPLPELTQMALGGPNSVRGFPASEVRGDYGSFVSAGLRRGFALGPVTLLARVYGDTGQVFSRSASGTRNSLTSWGLGFDAQWRTQAFSANGRVEGRMIQ